MCLWGNRKSSVRLIWQSDGNLVLYQGRTALFASNTANRGADSLNFQPDGNVVIYRRGRPLWDTRTSALGRPSSTKYLMAIRRVNGRGQAYLSLNPARRGKYPVEGTGRVMWRSDLPR